MSHLNKDATLAKALAEFPKLSKEALALYWAALQSHNRVNLASATGAAEELVAAKMGTLRSMRGGSFKLILTSKAAEVWPVRRVPAKKGAGRGNGQSAEVEGDGAADDVVAVHPKYDPYMENYVEPKAVEA